MSNAYLFRMNNGQPGSTNRDVDKWVEQSGLSATNPPAQYGLAVAWDTNTGLVRNLQVGDLVEQVIGVATRPFPLQSAGAQMGQATPIANGVLDVLRRGYISVRVQDGNTPTRGGAVYVRVANPNIANNVYLGGFEVQPTANNILLLGASYYTGGIDQNNVAEIHFQSVTSLTAGEGGGVSAVGLTMPTGFSVLGSPVTSSGTLAVSYSGQIPPLSLGTGVPDNTKFLRGDGTWAVPSSTGGGITLQVDGTTVPATNNVINLRDSTSLFNRIQFSNPNTNNIEASVDPTTSLLVTEVLIANTGATNSVAIDVPDDLAADYGLVLPPMQGSPNTYLRNDGSGNLTWATITGGSGTVTSIGMTVPAPLSVTPTTGITTSGVFTLAWGVGQVPTANLGTNTSDSTKYLRGDGAWTTFPNLTTLSVNGAYLATANLQDNALTAAGMAWVNTSGAVTATPKLYSTITGATGQFQTMNVSGTGVTSASLSNGVLSLVISGGGGGGGGDFSSVTAKWTTANAASKNAYSAPSVINVDGITINLTASINPGSLTTATVVLNGINLTNAYSITGNFPNYAITIPSADLAVNTAETLATVTVGVVIGTTFNLQANNLTNVQPIPFAASLGANYSVTTVPFYQTTAGVNYTYAITGTAQTYGGTINGVAAAGASGSLANIAVTGLTIGGSAVGNGQFGAAQNVTVALSGNVPGLPTYTPAFFAGASTGSTAPTFTTSSQQTPGSQIGATITFTQATVSTQYVWLATTRSISMIRLITNLGPAPVTADSTGTQTIGSLIFNVFGFTNLDTTAPIQMMVN